MEYKNNERVAKFYFRIKDLVENIEKGELSFGYATMSSKDKNGKIRMINVDVFDDVAEGMRQTIVGQLEVKDSDVTSITCEEYYEYVDED